MEQVATHLAPTLHCKFHCCTMLAPDVAPSPFPMQVPIFPVERGDLAVSYLPAWHGYGRTLE